MLPRSLDEQPGGLLCRKPQGEALFLAAREAEDGRGRIVLMEGEAGSGKTALAMAFLDLLGRSGFITASGKCLFSEGGLAYQPFRDVARVFESIPRIRELGDEGAREDGSGHNAAIRAPALASLALAGGLGFSDSLGPTSGPGGAGKQGDGRDGPVPGQMDREDFFRQFSRSIAAVAPSKPIGIFLDDMQWADASTCGLLHHLSLNTRTARLLLLVAFRPEDLSHGGAKCEFGKLLPLIRPASVTIPLTPLDAQAVGALAVRSCPGGKMDEQSIMKIHRETGGNPFFVTEVLKEFCKTGDTGGQGDAAGMSGIHGIPETVNDLISLKLSRTTPDDLKVLRMAAVLGSRFEFRHLRLVLGGSEESIVDALERLMALNLIKEDSTGKEEAFRFEHNIIRQSILGSMSRSRQRITHAACGAALESSLSGSQDGIVQLAHHFSSGQIKDKAAMYCRRAGEVLLASLSYDESLAMFRLAGKAAEAAGQPRAVIEVLMHEGRLLDLLSRSDEALRAFERARELALASGESETAAEASVAAGDVHSRRWDFHAGKKHYEEALARYEISGSGAGKARVYRSLSFGFFSANDLEMALECTRKALDLGESGAEKGRAWHASRAVLLRQEGMILVRQGRMSEALAAYERAADLTSGLDSRELMYFLNSRGYAWLVARNAAGALEDFSAALVLARKLDDRRETAMTLENLGQAAIVAGKSKEALEHLEQALAIKEELPQKDLSSGLFGLPKTLAAIAEAQCLARDIDGARRSAERATEIIAATGDPYADQRLRRLEGIIMEHSGRTEEAINILGGVLNMGLDPPTELDVLERLDRLFEKLGADHDFGKGGEDHVEEARKRRAERIAVLRGMLVPGSDAGEHGR